MRFCLSTRSVATLTTAGAVTALVALGIEVPPAVTPAPENLATMSGAAATMPRITKVLVFVEENHSLSQMASSMPFVYGLAKQYAYATNYTAIRHPSLPNYLAIAGGSTFGVSDDKDRSAHRISGNSVFDQALRAGRTAKVYAESAPARCALHDSGYYAVRHNPWTYFASRRAACRRHDVRVSALARDVAARRLPTVGMVIPNLVHDAHDSSLAAADAWIKKKILMIQQGPDWASGHLAVVITADEDDHNQGNKVMTVLASRYQPRMVITTALNHFSLTRFIDDVAGTRYLRGAATAASMTAAFGVRSRRP